MATPEKPIWRDAEAAFAPLQIEGTEVPLVTDGPVHPPQRRRKGGTAKPEQLFEIPETKDKEPKATRRRRPYRARGKDSTDASVREYKSALEGEDYGTYPDADIDRLFGAGPAMRYLFEKRDEE